MTRRTLGDLLDTLTEANEFLDNYVDVVDGADGQPRPNRAMRLHTQIDALLPIVEREWKAELK